MTRNTILTLFITLSLACSGCSNWLDVQPKNEVTREKIYTQPGGFQDALTHCYIDMASRNLYGENLTFGYTDLLANLWQRPSSPDNLYRLIPMFDFESTKMKTLTQTIYDQLYNTIVSANVVLAELDKHPGTIADEQLREVIRGEGHAIRALLHFEVLRLFGQIPNGATLQRDLYYSYTDNLTVLPTKCSYAEYVKLVEKDFKAAEDLLSKHDPALKYSFEELNSEETNHSPELAKLNDYLYFRQFRLNIYAVRALMARFYQYTGAKELATQYAKSVVEATVNGKPVVTLSTNSDARQSWFGSPSEALFLLSTPQLATYAQTILGNKSETGTLSENELYVSTANLTNKVFMKENLASDVRFVSIWKGGKRTISGGNMSVLQKYFYDTENLSNLNRMMTKQQVVPVIRLSELYLILMENSNSVGEINSLYDTYMRSKNVLITTPKFDSVEKFKLSLVNEYVREFFGEGQMFGLYKRLGTQKMLFQKETMSEDKYCIPVPDTESINKNK